MQTRAYTHLTNSIIEWFDTYGEQTIHTTYYSDQLPREYATDFIDDYPEYKMTHVYAKTYDGMEKIMVLVCPGSVGYVYPPNMTISIG